MIEIESLAELDDAAARAGDSGSMRDWQVQGLDLTGHEEVLLRLDPAGALFLGCRISEPTADRLREGGALIFPQVPDVPFDPWRPHLYTPGRALRRAGGRLRGHRRRTHLRLVDERCHSTVR